MGQDKSGRVKQTSRPLGQMLLSYAASSGSLLAASVAQLMTFAILARSLGAEQFGLLITILALTAIATHICGLGSTESLLRRVAQNKQVYSVLFGHCLSLIALTGAALVLLGMSVLPLWIELSTQGNYSGFAIFLLLITNIVLVRLILLVEQIYIAHGQYRAANVSVVGFAFARMLTAALACLVFTTENLFTWAIWQFACHIIVVMIYYYFIWKLGRPVYRIIRQEIRLGMLFSSQFVFRAARQNVDLLMLSALMPAGFVGSYAIVRRIIDSSTMGIEAMNRLTYPRLAIASAKNSQNAVAMAQKLQLAALAIGFFTSVSIFIFAPILPYLFGSDYDNVVQYARILCWTVVFFALWAVPLETLGAAGLHGYRSVILNSGNIIGGILLAFATWLYPPEGTFAAFYMIDIALALAAWFYLLKTMRRQA